MPKVPEKTDFPVSQVRRYLEPGPIVLVSSKWQGAINIMTLGWHTILEFSPSLVGLMISGGNHSHRMIRESRECVVNLPTTAQIETLVRFETRLGAVVSSDHPLAGLEMMPLRNCLGYPLIFADRSMVMHSIVSEAFTTAGLVAEPTFVTNSIEAMKSLAALSDGIAFLSKFDVAEEQHNGTLSYISIRDGTFGKNVLSLVQREKRGRAIAATIFAEDLKRSLH